MITHFIFLGVLLISNLKSRLSRKTALILSFFILFLFCALRYDFGNDYMSYYTHYQSINSGADYVFNKNPGYVLLNKIAPTFQILIATISTALIIVIYRTIVNNVDKEFYGISLFILLINPYVFLVLLSAIRQSIALILFVVAINFSYKHKPIPYILLILTATLFHTSAIVLLPFYFIANERKINKITIVLYLIIVAVFILDKPIFDGTIEYFLQLFDEDLYNYYYNQGVSNSIRATILSSLYFIYIAINIPYLSGKALMYSKLYLIGLTAALLAYNFSMMTRLQMYFDIFSIISIPSIIRYSNSSIGEKNNKVFHLINAKILPTLIFAIYILRYYSFFTNPLWESFTSYQTIIELI